MVGDGVGVSSSMIGEGGGGGVSSRVYKGGGLGDGVRRQGGDAGARSGSICSSAASNELVDGVGEWGA
jgi:hypothetical protein